MGNLTAIPAALAVHDVCDHCRRQFSRVRGDSHAVCPSCGLENVRPAERIPESAMLAPAVESAMRPSPVPRPRSRKKASRK
jgi:predicted amidophosphoribosyltransferase